MIRRTHHTIPGDEHNDRLNCWIDLSNTSTDDEENAEPAPIGLEPGAELHVNGDQHTVKKIITEDFGEAEVRYTIALDNNNAVMVRVKSSSNVNKSWWTLRYGLFENSVGDNGDIVNHGEIPLRTLTIDGDTYQIDSDGSDDRDLDREASEIGLIGSNTARTPTLNALEDAGIDYEQTGTLTAKRGNRSQQASAYQYEKDGETRWMVEWSERAGIDEARFCSLIFDREPDQTRLSHGVEIYDQRRTDRVQALFEQ